MTRHLKTTNGKLIASFQEIESGTNNDRPELKDAVALAKKRKATLIVAKLDRLGRKASYILRLIDESGVNFHICDMPDADKLTITILAAIAEREALNTSQRTKAALAVKKAQGVKLGNPRLEEARTKAIRVIKAGKKARAGKVIGIIEELQSKAHVTTLAGLAECLNLRGIPTPRNGRWTATSVRRVMAAA